MDKETRRMLYKGIAYWALAAVMFAIHLTTRESSYEGVRLYWLG